MSMGEEEIDPILSVLKRVVFDFDIVVFFNKELSKVPFKFISGEDDKSINFSSIDINFCWFWLRCRVSGINRLFW